MKLSASSSQTTPGVAQENLARSLASLRPDGDQLIEISAFWDAALQAKQIGVG